MPNKDIIISTLKSMKPELAAKYHIDSLALFGSVAIGEAKQAKRGVEALYKKDVLYV